MFVCEPVCVCVRGANQTLCLTRFNTFGTYYEGNNLNN